MLFESSDLVDYLTSILRPVTEGLHDLSLHSDQYYILVSETNYPPSQYSAHPESCCWKTLPLFLVQLVFNHS